MKLSIKLLSVLIITIIVAVQATSTQIQAAGEWKTMKTFTGSAPTGKVALGQKTENFTVPINYWRIVCTIKAQDEQYASFHALVYPSGETARYVSSVDLRQSGTNTTYVRAGPGDFHVKVSAANLNSWTIEVQTQQ